jgi:hypothetical protein
MGRTEQRGQEVREQMGMTISSAIEPLVRRKIFASEEEAARELLRSYILREIAKLQREITRLERKYGMRFQQFAAYLHERSLLLEKGELPPEQRQALGQAIMREEDDWLDWKAAQEMLETWLGLGKEVAG